MVTLDVLDRSDALLEQEGRLTGSWGLAWNPAPPEAPTGRRLQAGADAALDPVGEGADSLLPVAVAARVHPGRVVGRDREPSRDLLRVARLDVDQALVGRSPQ